MYQKTTKPQQKQSAQAVVETWNNVAGVMKIYGNEFKQAKGNTWTKWSVSVGKKDLSTNEYINYYIQVRFAKNASVPQTPGLHAIEVTHGFLSPVRFKLKDGTEVDDVELVVVENTIVD